MRVLLVAMMSSCGGGDPVDVGDDPFTDPCGQATGSAFRLTVWHVEVSERKPDGRAWDLDGSYADVYVCIGSDDSSWDMGCTGVVTDRTSVDFSDYTEGVARVNVHVEVWDDDLSDDDYIGGFYATPSDLKTLADCGEQEFSGTGDNAVQSWCFRWTRSRSETGRAPPVRSRS